MEIKLSKYITNLINMLEQRNSGLDKGCIKLSKKRFKTFKTLTL